MKKRIINISIIVLVVVALAIAVVVMFTPSLDSGNATEFWDRTNGSYQLEYSMVGDDGIMASMVAKYLTDPVEVSFSGDEVTLAIAMNISADTDSTLSLLIGEGYVVTTKCPVHSVGEVSVFELTTTKEHLTDTLTFKLKAGTMPFEPEFSVLMDVDNASFVSSHDCC